MFAHNCRKDLKTNLQRYLHIGLAWAKGQEMATTRGLFFLPPEEKGASLCRSIVLGFESAKKDEFVSYSIDKR